MHHDICPMPNGNVLIISYETKTAAEVTQAGSSTSHIMWPDKIIEVKPTGATTGNIVWEWHVWDHLVQNYDASKDNYQSSTNAHPELLNLNYKNTSSTTDWMHSNGIDYNPILDQIVFSSHNMNEMYVIDHSTTSAEAASHSGGNSGKGGDFLYRWGNPLAYGASGTADLNVVHDAHWVPGDCPRAGQLVGFNNNGVSSSQSAVDIFTPPYTGYTYNLSSSGNTPATYGKRYALSGHTNDMGNSQQLPNGNNLFCIAMSGLIYETDSAGTTLWSKSVSGTVPQAFRYKACYVNNAAPATPTVTANGNVLTSTSASSYQWYYNGTLISGATSQTYTATQNGIYLVQVANASGCAYNYSNQYHYASTTGISQSFSSSGIQVYPNPTTGLLHISAKALQGEKYKVTIYDAVGKQLEHVDNASTIDMSAYEAGIYYLILKADDNSVYNVKFMNIK